MITHRRKVVRFKPVQDREKRFKWRGNYLSLKRNFSAVQIWFLSQCQRLLFCCFSWQWQRNSFLFLSGHVHFTLKLKWMSFFIQTSIIHCDTKLLNNWNLDFNVSRKAFFGRVYWTTYKRFQFWPVWCHAV